mgnify:CR=1 FL=1
MLDNNEKKTEFTEEEEKRAIVYALLNQTKLNKEDSGNINTLSENNVRLYFIDINKNATQQVFTQDIGFSIDDVLFISKMKQKELTQLLIKIIQAAFLLINLGQIIL